MLIPSINKGSKVLFLFQWLGHPSMAILSGNIDSAINTALLIGAISGII
jgi:hypothetical protein